MIEIKEHIYLFENELTQEFCKDIINKFEDEPSKKEGRLLGPSGTRINIDKKKCTNVEVDPANPRWVNCDKVFFESCSKIVNKVSEKHHELRLEPLQDKGYLLQRYLPGEYFKPHVDSCSSSTCNRLLAVIWYINDIDDGGETFFHFQDIKIKPKAGNAIAFPCSWTHRHEGLPVISDTKYICTTFVQLVGGRNENHELAL